MKQSALEETLRVTASVREKLREKEASIERKEAVTANAYAALLSILEERAGVITDLERRIERVNHFLSANGCDCECDHSAEDHDDDCARCVACVSTYIVLVQYLKLQLRALRACVCELQCM